MIKNIFAFVTYPSTAGVIGLIWIGTAALIFIDPQLPILRMIFINILVSFFIGFLGFRVERR